MRRDESCQGISPGTVQGSYGNGAKPEFSGLPTKLLVCKRIHLYKVIHPPPRRASLQAQKVTLTFFCISWRQFVQRQKFLLRFTFALAAVWVYKFILLITMDGVYVLNTEELGIFLNFWVGRNVVLEQQPEDVYVEYCRVFYEQLCKKPPVEGAPPLQDMNVKEVGTRLRLKALVDRKDLEYGMRHAIVHLLTTTRMDEDAYLKSLCPGKKYEGKTIGEVFQTHGGYSYLLFLYETEDFDMDDLTRRVLGDLLIKYKPASQLELPCPGKKYSHRTLRQVLEEDKQYHYVYFILQNFENLAPEMRTELEAWFDEPKHKKIKDKLTASKKRKVDAVSAWDALPKQ